MNATPTPAAAQHRGSNHVGLRQFNERVVLHALRVHGSRPKAELARITGLTAQTISLIIARLNDEGLIVTEARLRGKIGQPSVPIGLNPHGAFAIGIKIGRRNAECLLVDFCGHVRERRSVDYAFPDHQTLLPTLGAHIQALHQSLAPNNQNPLDLRSRVVGVGVAAPLQLGGWHSLLGLTDTQAQAWNTLDIGQAVQALTALPVTFVKDTLAACVAELVQGLGRAHSDYLYLFMDTFVGGGVVLHAQVHHGRHGNAGAVASLPLGLADEMDATNAQHKPQQLLRLASLWELEQRLRTHALDPTAAYDARALESPWRAHTEAWLKDAANAMAHAILSGTAFLDLSTVIVDGAMDPSLLQLLVTQTQAALARYNWEGLSAAPQLHCGTLGSSARALGGALLPLHNSFAPDHAVYLK